LKAASTCAVEDCDQPSPGAYVCRSCGSRLARDLGDVAALARELETSLAKESRFPPRPGASRPRPKSQDDEESPLPWDQRARDAGFQLRSTVVGVVRTLLESGADDPPAVVLPGVASCGHRGCAGVCEQRWPQDEMASMAAWLLARVQAIRKHPAGGELVDELRLAVREVRRAVDRPPDMLFAGLCDCGERLWLRPGARSLTCPVCGAMRPVTDRAEMLLASAVDRLARGPHIASFLSIVLGHTVRASAIRKWAHREKLEAVSVDVRGRPLYRVGDVLDLVVARVDDESDDAQPVGEAS
jgi:hypothetical protein